MKLKQFLNKKFEEQGWEKMGQCKYYKGKQEEGENEMLKRCVAC